MPNEATEVKDVMIPASNILDEDGFKWLTFNYSDGGPDDKDPWRWPKVIKYQGQLYAWMSWNSDRMKINYKEINENELATIVKRKR